MLWCSKKVSACLQYRDFSMRVWMQFCQFLRKVSTITRCLLYSMPATDGFDCILVLLVNKMDMNYIFPTWFFITAEWQYFMIKKKTFIKFYNYFCFFASLCFILPYRNQPNQCPGLYMVGTAIIKELHFFILNCYFYFSDQIF